VKVITFLLPLMFVFTSCVSTNKSVVIKKVNNCYDGTCKKVQDTQSKNNFAESLYMLLKENTNQMVRVCEADPQTKECTKPEVSHYVQGGALPGVKSFDHYKLGESVIFDRGAHTISFNRKDYSTFWGMPVNSPPHKAVISLNGYDNIVWDEKYYTTWRSVGQMTATFNVKIDHLNVSDGTVSGYYDTGVKGAGIGFGSGYLTMKFPNKKPRGISWNSTELMVAKNKFSNNQEIIQRERKTVVDENIKLAPRKTAQDKAELRRKVQSEFGNFHAIVIGNNEYTKLNKLNTAVNDATALADLLQKSYGFKVKRLLNATRNEIVSTLSEYRRKLKSNDNLLIYYAGHGWMDEAADEGYWHPIDADKDNNVNWISNATITSNIRAYKAKHVLIVADSCYSGKLVRALKPNLQSDANEYLMKMAEKKARVVMTSGDLEPVEDGGGEGNHSIFNSEVIKVLKQNDSAMTAMQVFEKIKRPILLKSDQNPRYSDIRKAGHDGGDFIFIKH